MDVTHVHAVGLLSSLENFFALVYHCISSLDIVFLAE